MTPLAPIEKKISSARRRLFLHALLNRVAADWAIALLLSLGWFLAEPWVVSEPPTWLKWSVLAGTALVGTIVAIWLAIRATPARDRVALELDHRFGLKERVTTALLLNEQERNSDAGRAVLADASAQVSPIVVRSRFPVQLGWHSATVPVLVASMVAVTFLYHPTVGQSADDSTDPAAQKKADAVKLKQDKKTTTPFTAQNKPPELANRGDKSKELKELEESLNEMMKKHDLDPARDTPEKARERVTDMTSMEEKLKKFQQEKFERLARMEQQLMQLDRLNKDEDFKDGPAKKLNDALSKGDIKKAAEELDMLKKKIQDKKLTKEEQEQLSKQLEKMKNEIKQLAKNQERQQQLKELIDKAKQEGKDAESLERELKQLQEEAKKAAETTQNLAQKLQKAQDALKKGDFEDMAKELDMAGQAMKDLEGDLQDLEDASEYLQRLKEEKEKACKQCQGNKDGDEYGHKDDADWSEFTNPASGRRKEDRTGSTSSEDQRIRGLFNPKGHKTYGGSTRGPAFKKATAAELGPAIEAAAQEAPRTADDPRFPRDAKDTVKEYFQNLGGQTPDGK